MHNKEIRAAAKNAGIFLWEVAEAYGINDGNFSRKLRKELPKEEKDKIKLLEVDEKRKRISLTMKDVDKLEKENQ